MDRKIGAVHRKLLDNHKTIGFFELALLSSPTWSGRAACKKGSFTPGDRVLETGNHSLVEKLSEHARMHGVEGLFGALFCWRQMILNVQRHSTAKADPLGRCGDKAQYGKPSRDRRGDQA